MFEKVKQNVRTVALTCAVPAVAAVTAVSAFAAGESGSAGLAINEGMLQPLVDGVVANIGVILPVGLGLFAIFIGIKIIPGIIKKFTNS